jgi:N-methylhydantoinase A/oxoprolinase/acetone carboxylase beta subunit
VPPHAGVLSALGLAIAPERRETLASLTALPRAGAECMRDAALDNALESLAASLHAPESWPRQWWVRARYQGQGHELEVPVVPGMAPATLDERMAALHRARYSFVLDRPVELVAARAVAQGQPRAVTLARAGARTWDDALRVDDGGPCDAVVKGPATIALPDATLLVRAGWTATALPIGGWIVEADDA